MYFQLKFQYFCSHLCAYLEHISTVAESISRPRELVDDGIREDVAMGVGGFEEDPSSSTRVGTESEKPTPEKQHTSYWGQPALRINKKAA